MTITEFLAARYDEEERRAPVYREITGWLAAMFGPVDASMKEVQPGMAAQIALARTADRIDADIAAKRAIVELAGRATEADRRMLAAEGATDPGPPYIGDPFLWALAQPYAEHPDFDPAWRTSGG